MVTGVQPQVARQEDGEPATARRRHVGLTFTLTSLTVTIVLVSVIAVVAVVRVSEQQARDDIEQRYGRTSTLAVRSALARHLAPAAPLLTEARERAESGRMAVDDRAALADFLIDRARYQPDISFFMYGDQKTGSLVGARRRDDGAVILVIAAPDVKQGQPREWEVARDGTKTPVTSALPGDYDPRVRPWYRLALKHQEPAWTVPYQFASGGSGITAVQALASPNGGERGVFAIDFRLDQASAALRSLLEGGWRVREPTIAVLTRAEEPLAYSFDPSDAGKVALVARALAASPTPPFQLPLTVAERASFESSGTRYVAYLQAEPVSDTLETVTAFIVPADELYDVVNRTQQTAVVVGVLLIGMSIFACIFVSRRISQPIGEIAADLEAVGRFELSAQPLPRSFVREVVVVANAADRMKASLRSFSRYVPRQLVQDVLMSGEEARLGGHGRVLSLYFSDVAGFTRISELMPPDELVEYLGEYLQEMTAIIERHHGAVDKFIGDGILALFNAPRDVEDHPRAVCRAALDCQARLRVLRHHWAGLSREPLHVRIGLHTGRAIVGNIGTPDRFEYTVTGDAVNLASRLEGLNKVFATEILASEDLRTETGSDFEWRTLDRVAVVGRTNGTLVCELLGKRDQVDLAVLRARDLYERALEAYFKCEFEQAAGLFRLAGSERPGDRAASVLSERAVALVRDPPAADWDGTFHATSK